MTKKFFNIIVNHMVKLTKVTHVNGSPGNEHFLVLLPFTKDQINVDYIDSVMDMSHKRKLMVRSLYVRYNLSDKDAHKCIDMWKEMIRGKGVFDYG